MLPHILPYPALSPLCGTKKTHTKSFQQKTTRTATGDDHIHERGREHISTQQSYRPDCEDSLVTGQLALLPADRTLTVHVFVDSGGPQASPAIAEAFFQEGRVALSTPTPLAAGSCAGVLASSDGASVSEAAAWALGDIWISEDEFRRSQ